MNTKLAYPCPKCAHSEVIDFAKPPKACSNCKEPFPKLELPQENKLPLPSEKNNGIINK